jgi:hypothetical protein
VQIFNLLAMTIVFSYIKKTALCSILLFSLASCKDLLDITPPSQVSPENYFNDESHLASYTIARYESVFRTVEGSGGAGLYLDDAGTDNMTNRKFRWQLGFFYNLSIELLFRNCITKVRN